MLRSINVALAAAVAMATLGAGASAAQTNAPPWRWSDAPDLYPKVELRAKRLHSAFVLREVSIGKGDSHAELRRELSKGGITKVVWRVAIKTRQWTDLVGAAMMVSGDTIFIARYNRIATGCTLSAFSTVDGSLRWSAALIGVGPVSHSKWFNRVQLDMINNNPVAFGNEGPGMGYIEVRAAATGKLVTKARRKVAGGRPRVLAESLYRELANMLSRKPRHTVSLADFASRHVFRFATVAVRDRAFRDAAIKLDGVRFEKGIMRVSVAPDPNGALVVKAVRR